MPPVAVTPHRFEALARVLSRAGQRALLDPGRFRELHAAFMAADATGTWWTVGLESGQWNRLEADEWTPGQPPGELFVDAELRGDLERLEVEIGNAPAEATPIEAVPSRAAEADEAAGVSRYAPPGYAPPRRDPDSGAARPATAAEPARSRARETPGAAPPAPPARSRQRLEDDWSHVLLCVTIAGAFAALGYWKGDPRAFAGAGLFALLVVILTVMNLAQSRR